MNYTLQPILENEFVTLKPLAQSDFETLFSVASDPLIWEQHPNKNRYQLEVFTTFFRGAIESQGAFLVFNKKTGEAIGSSRFYDMNEETSSIAIGYTFLARSHWGTTYNRALKTIMLDYAFLFVDRVIFHIGALNIRSQKSITKLGAQKIGEIEMEYYGETQRLNFIYQIEKKSW